MAGIEQHFGETFAAQIYADYQKHTAVLRNLVDTVPCVGVQTVHFKKKGTYGTGTKSRNGDIPVFKSTDATVSVTTVDRYTSDILDTLDIKKQNANQQGSATDGLMAAMARWVDTTISTALDATTTLQNWTGADTVAGTCAGPFTYEVFKEILGTFMDRNVMGPTNGMIGMPSNMTIVIGPRQYLQFRDFIGVNGQSLLTVSEDFSSTKRMEVSPEVAFKWGGFNFVVMTGLPTVTDAATVECTKCFAFDRNAVGLALQLDPTVEVGRRIEKGADMITVTASMAAKIIQDLGTLQFNCTNS